MGLSTAPARAANRSRLGTDVGTDHRKFKKCGYLVVSVLSILPNQFDIMLIGVWSAFLLLRYIDKHGYWRLRIEALAKRGVQKRAPCQGDDGRLLPGPVQG